MDQYLVTFGKHKGHTLQQLVDDKGYIDWLMREDRRGWWQQQWEAKAIVALQHGLEVPPVPKVREILEHEIDWAVERPAKVRKITNVNYASREFIIACPNCGEYEIERIRDTDGFRCYCCAQHFSTVIQPGRGDWRCCVKPFDCPSWASVTDDQRKIACQHCPNNISYLGDHTTCGCFKDFECQCNVAR